jgi:hypothetical protein
VSNGLARIYGTRTPLPDGSDSRTYLAHLRQLETQDSNGRTIWIADAHRDDGQRFIVHADEKLTAFVELEAAIRGCGE